MLEPTSTPQPAAGAAPLLIRRATADDAPAIARVYEEPSVRANLLQLPFINVESMRQWLVEQSAPGRVELQLVAHRAGQVLGAAGLAPAAPQLRRRHAMGLGIGVASAVQGQGVGSALMRALCDYADRWAQVLRLELNVFTDNERAIALYRRFGFRIEGTHRGYALRDGVYADVYAMARLHPDPPRLAWPGPEPDAGRELERDPGCDPGPAAAAAGGGAA
jgi:putative acetyltransferase